MAAVEKVCFARQPSARLLCEMEFAEISGSIVSQRASSGKERQISVGHVRLRSAWRYDVNVSVCPYRDSGLVQMLFLVTSGERPGLKKPWVGSFSPLLHYRWR